ncbi:sin3 histone deacetylase corepressor complex component SDS3-like isoform X2 [Biomphalaria glabrata]|uniref:Sin3 histone deacetylase corepressor complex component SDS3-like isoform X2 n=1 Tax=Biomphalaria glabrata TaxID=6526 RepID=A0A2C9LLU9_BIOGL|nr:sin3 histone deacetylase corepressor complex component SDS3-like isoform X2 [Biomphalaria glabrata]
MSIVANSPRNGTNDCVDADSSEMDDDKEGDENASDEDTADASETEDKPKAPNQNAPPSTVQRTEIKEQMYQDKLAQIKKHIGMLQEGSLPEFLKRTKKIELHYRERLRQNEISKSVEIERADKNYQTDCNNAQKEFEEKKIDMKESLISDLKEKRGLIELERQTVDLNGADFMEVKPTMTRKLRRRPNDPVPIPEKRRKPSPAQVSLLLDDEQISADLRVLLKVSGKPVAKKQVLTTPGPVTENTSDVRIEDGRLWYDKKWFQRNTMVQIDSKEGGPRIYGTITNIGNQEIWIKRSGDNSKLRIYISQFHKGKFVMKKRTT